MRQGLTTVGVVLAGILLAASAWAAPEDPAGEGPVPGAASSPRVFEHPVPEELVGAGYACARAVRAATATRTFGAGEEADYRLALEAREALVALEARLQGDARARRELAARRLVMRDFPSVGSGFVVGVDGPFVFVYASRHPISEFDLLWREADQDRAELEVAIAERRERARKVVEDRGRVFRAIHDEYRRRFGERLRLRPLEEPWGGRADLDPARRAHPDGFGLVVLFLEEQESTRGGLLGFGSTALLREEVVVARTGDAARGPAREQRYEQRLEGRAVARQVHRAFARQRHGRWDAPMPLGMFEEGVAAWLGSFELLEDPAGPRLVFTGEDPLRVSLMRLTRRAILEQGREVPFFPLRALLGFPSHVEATNHALAAWGLSCGMPLAHDQAYALARYLDARHPAVLPHVLGAALLWSGRERGTERDEVVEAFARSLGLETEEDWAELQRAWEAWFRETFFEE